MLLAGFEPRQARMTKWLTRSVLSVIGSGMVVMVR
jgi:hypothetical protein